MNRVLPLRLLSSSTQRAREVLLAWTTPAEYERLMSDGYLDVRSPSDETIVYRIPRWGGCVEMFVRGVPTVALCLRPESPLPMDDVVVMLKALILGNESEFRFVAQAWPIAVLPEA
jgi:hypothetical protein